VVSISAHSTNVLLLYQGGKSLTAPEWLGLYAPNLHASSEKMTCRGCHSIQAAGLFRICPTSPPGPPLNGEGNRSARTSSSHHMRLGNQALARSHFRQSVTMWETHTRNPILLLKLFGLFLLRYAQRALFRLLLNEPPRSTRCPWTRPSQRGIHPVRDNFIQPPSNLPISATITET
jgi:hypothetical protein